MYRIQTIERKVFSPENLPGQGIVAAAKAYFAKQSYDKHQSYFYMVDGIINYNNDYKFIRDKLANPFNHNGEKNYRRY